MPCLNGARSQSLRAHLLVERRVALLNLREELPCRDELVLFLVEVLEVALRQHVGAELLERLDVLAQPCLVFEDLLDARLWTGG